jgi:hypothetical protein
MSSFRWKSELRELPALALSEVASEPVRLMLTGLARQQGMTLQQWLALRLRSLAVMALPTDARERLLARHNRDFFSQGPDYVALSCPSEEKDVPDDACFWSGATLIEDDIRAAAADARAYRQQVARATRHQHRLWKPTAVDRTRTLSTTDPRQHWHKRLQEAGSHRDIVRVTQRMMRRVERLLIDAPNFRETTLFVLGQLALAGRGRRELRVPPILLVGPPAAGKTWWAEQLARAMDLHCECITLPSVTANFELSGGSTQWAASQPGQIMRTFVQTKRASPVFVLDEIDKTLTNTGYAVAPALLGLIDRSAATRWRDEFYDQEFDVSRALFVATANHPERMDSALRSRFLRFDVRAPLRSERAALIASVWQQYRLLRADIRLPKTLRADVIDILVDRFDDARQMLRLFDDGLGRAARRRGPLFLMPADVGGPVAHLAWNKGTFPTPQPAH